MPGTTRNVVFLPAINEHKRQPVSERQAVVKLRDETKLPDLLLLSSSDTSWTSDLIRSSSTSDRLPSHEQRRRLFSLHGNRRQIFSQEERQASKLNGGRLDVEESGKASSKQTAVRRLLVKLVYSLLS